MKTPIDAEGHPGATLALLNSGADFQMADLWAITLNGGDVIRWHGAGLSSPLTFNGATYLAGPGVDRGKISTKLGLEVATLDVVFTAGSTDLINGVPLIAFAQGMAVLGAASERRGYKLDLAAVARIWRGGCIIRTALLEEIRAAFGRRSGLENLLLDPALSRLALEQEPGLRSVVCAAARAGIPMPGMMSALAYLDSFRSEWLPANLIQAQRDCFGAHGYERVDRPGSFHSEWEKE